VKSNRDTVAAVEPPSEELPNEELQHHASNAPRPTSLAQTGLTLTFLGDLVGKHLAASGVLSLSQVIERLALAGPIVEQALQFLRKEGRIEVRGPATNESELRFGLTERGRNEAQDALQRSGYLGPAPVPLATYCDIVKRQTVHARKITRDMMHERFEGIVLGESVVDQLGAAMNSGRAIFIYGAAGTGKTYIAQRLYRICDATVLVPHAVLVNDTVIQVFDPQIHETVEFMPAPSPLRLEQGYDTRFVCCERPTVITGGELTMDMLEVRFEPSLRIHVAPLQMKANNGIFIIDDLGRQRLSTDALFNRWIVPMEEQRDHLGLANGLHFTVPFDVVLVFSTNLNPTDVADEAFLRRIGYKIAFKPIPVGQYRQIWAEVCRKHGLYMDPSLVDYVVHELHEKRGVALLPCHPRDLIGMALDHRVYSGAELDLTEKDLRWAWNNYFLDAGLKQGAH
jgi:DNA-binding MarR family transcriptional regulator